MSSAHNRDSPLVMRPYQREALDIMERYEGRAGLLVLGTGLGKTAIFTQFLRHEVLENDRQCLILSHRAELVHQPLQYLSGIPCGIELAEKHAANQPVISASVQSLVGRLGRYHPRQIDTIIVDEAHHAAAPTYRKILNYFCAARIFGFTATSHRGDDVGLGCVFNDLLFEKDTLWGIQNGYLTPMQCHQVRLKYNMGSVKVTADGDFAAGDVARIMSGTALGVVEAYERYAHGQTIIFAASTDEATDITDILNRRAQKRIAAAILAGTSHRSAYLTAYQLGALKVLVNYGVLTEGTDLPSTETVIIARPIAHTNVGLYAQMVGRGLRLHPGKTVCHVVDCVGISDYPICTAATLIGKPIPAEKPEEEPTEKDPPVADRHEVLTSDQLPQSWIAKQKEVDIMEKGVGVDMHNVAWVALQQGGYILPIPNVVYRISRPLQDGTVYLRKNKACSKSPMPLQFVFDYVYQDLAHKHANCRHIWDKEQRRYWDKQRITNEQYALIHKLAPDYHVDAKKMTRGDASALIQILLYKPEEFPGQKEGA